MADGRIPQLDVLGVNVSATDIPSATEQIDGWIREGYRSYATVTGVHGVMEPVRSEEVRRVHNAAGLVLPDGMPLVWLLWQAGFKWAARVYGPDLMLALFKQSEEAGYRHFLYGALPRTLELVKDNLQQKVPQSYRRRGPCAPLQTCRRRRGRSGD